MCHIPSSACFIGCFKGEKSHYDTNYTGPGNLTHSWLMGADHLDTRVRNTSPALHMHMGTSNVVATYYYNSNRDDTAEATKMAIFLKTFLINDKRVCAVWFAVLYFFSYLSTQLYYVHSQNVSLCEDTEQNTHISRVFLTSKLQWRLWSEIVLNGRSVWAVLCHFKDPIPIGEKWNVQTGSGK